MEIIAVLSFSALFWLVWQLFQAKKHTRFKRYIDTEIKPAVINDIKQELLETRSDLFPNNEVHEEATLYYWTEYRVRILQRALKREILDELWLKRSGYLRQSQHLFYVEQAALNKQL